MLDTVQCSDCSAQRNSLGPELRAVGAIFETELFGGPCMSTTQTERILGA